MTSMSVTSASSAAFTSASTTPSWRTPVSNHAPAMAAFAATAKFAHYATYGKSGTGISTQ